LVAIVGRLLCETFGAHRGRRQRPRRRRRLLLGQRPAGRCRPGRRGRPPRGELGPRRV